MGSGGCSSTKASLLCCFVSTAAAAIVRTAPRLPVRGWTCLTLLNGALPDDVGSAATGTSAKLCMLNTIVAKCNLPLVNRLCDDGPCSVLGMRSHAAEFPPSINPYFMLILT